MKCIRTEPNNSLSSLERHRLGDGCGQALGTTLLLPAEARGVPSELTRSEGVLHPEVPLIGGPRHGAPSTLMTDCLWFLICV